MNNTQPQKETGEGGRVNLAGAHFRVRHYNCIWIVLRYHRAGNWVCQEPDHGTTCHFHENEIKPNRLFQPVTRTS